jgi:hypothetical protein
VPSCLREEEKCPEEHRDSIPVSDAVYGAGYDPQVPDVIVSVTELQRFITVNDSVSLAP